MYTKMLIVIAFATTAIISKEYTLDNLIGEAVKNSRQVQSVKKEIEKNEYQVKEAIGSGLPKIKGSVNYSYGEAYSPFGGGIGGDIDTAQFNRNINNIYHHITSQIPDSVLKAHIQMGGPIITGVTLQQMKDMMSGLTESKKNSIALSLSLEQPIYAQGKVGIGLKIAKAYQATLKYKLSDEEIKVKGAITKLFYATLMAQKNVEIQKEAVKLSEETHRLAVIQHAVGKGSELDTLISRLRLENARIDVQKAQSDLRMSHEAMLTQTGIQDQTNSFVVKGDFPEVLFTLTADSAVGAVLKSNKQLKMLEETKLLQDQLVNLSKSDFYPIIYAGASMSKIGQFNTFEEFKNLEMGSDWKIFAGLSMDIFTGFRRSQKLNQTKTDRQIFILTKEQAEDGLQLATRNAYEQVIISKDRLGATKSVMVLAEKGYSIAKRAYEVGSKTFLDVQNAEFELNRAKIALNAAKFTFHTALVDLKLFMGDL